MRVSNVRFDKTEKKMTSFSSDTHLLTDAQTEPREQGDVYSSDHSEEHPSSKVCADDMQSQKEETVDDIVNSQSAETGQDSNTRRGEVRHTNQRSVSCNVDDMDDDLPPSVRKPDATLADLLSTVEVKEVVWREPSGVREYGRQLQIEKQRREVGQQKMR